MVYALSSKKNIISVEWHYAIKKGEKTRARVQTRAVRALTAPPKRALSDPAPSDDYPDRYPIREIKSRELEFRDVARLEGGMVIFESRAARMVTSSNCRGYHRKHIYTCVNV